MSSPSTLVENCSTGVHADDKRSPRRTALGTSCPRTNQWFDNTLKELIPTRNFTRKKWLLYFVAHVTGTKPQIGGTRFHFPSKRQFYARYLGAQVHVNCKMAVELTFRLNSYRQTTKFIIIFYKIQEMLQHKLLGADRVAFNIQTAVKPTIQLHNAKYKRQSQLFTNKLEFPRKTTLRFTSNNLTLTPRKPACARRMVSTRMVCRGNLTWKTMKNQKAWPPHKTKNPPMCSQHLQTCLNINKSELSLLHLTFKLWGFQWWTAAQRQNIIQ